MNKLQVCLEEEIRALNEVLKQAKEVIKNSPEGALRVAQKNPSQYYLVDGNTNKCGKYIRKSQRELAKQLAQKDYAQKVYKEAQAIKQELERTDGNAVQRLEELKHLHEIILPGRGCLVEPFWISDQDYVASWERRHRDENMKCIDEKYPLNEETGIETERGELVRSKSEKILADKLYMMGVPYVYEKVLFVDGMGYVHPDFLVLNKRTRREFYWEHFGMMDREEYCEKALRKIAVYEKNEIFVGKNLLVTYETSAQVLNTRRVEMLIKEFLL